MPSEYIMYLSILLVGSLAIAGISVTMIGIDNTMEERAIETNLENILQNIGETMHNLIQSGEEQITLGATSLEIQMFLTLPQKIHQQTYRISVPSTTNSYQLKAVLIDNLNIDVIISLFIDPATITMSGIILSTSTFPSVTFLYDGVDTSIILAG